MADPENTFMAQVNRLATRHNLAPAVKASSAIARKVAQLQAEDGPWDWEGPEEGDTCDLSVWLTYEGEEVFKIKTGTTRQKKSIARKIAALMNRGGVVR